MFVFRDAPNDFKVTKFARATAKEEAIDAEWEEIPPPHYNFKYTAEELMMVDWDRCVVLETKQYWIRIVGAVLFGMVIMYLMLKGG